MSVGTESTGKRCDSGFVKMKNIQCDPTEKLRIKTKWSNAVTGRSIGRIKENPKSNFGIKHNHTFSRRTAENWEKRTQKTSCCKSCFVLPNSGNNKPV